MKNLSILLALIAITSCGKSHSGGPGIGKETDPVSNAGALSADEMAVVKKLVNKGEVKQKDLIKILIDSKTVARRNLLQLDRFINVQCIHSSGLCFITRKD